MEQQPTIWVIKVVSNLIKAFMPDQSVSEQISKYSPAKAGIT